MPRVKLHVNCQIGESKALKSLVYIPILMPFWGYIPSSLMNNKSIMTDLS